MQKSAIIVPCFNEESRLNPESFTRFLNQHPSVTIFFVDDGSRDKTREVLLNISDAVPRQVRVLELNENRGKANAVQQGLIFAKEYSSFTYFGYLDADLSTDINEFYMILDLMKNGSLKFAFGARVKMMSKQIERSFFRHIIGRTIATIIDSKFRLGIYDTQCGAKWFSAELLDLITCKPFKTKWLFDVEIFIRIRQQTNFLNGAEIPLTSWKDPRGSKINVLHFPEVLRDILILMRFYQPS